MRKLIAIVFIAGLSTCSYAHESKHGNIQMGRELIGTFIGLSCFIKHASIGKDHKNCAIDCAKKGLPIALKTDDGIYQISGQGHTSLVKVYKPLLKFLESEVKVTGTLFKRSGMKMLVVDKVEKK